MLLLHPGALGDTILALPAIVRLRKAFPAAQWTLAGNIDHLDAIFSGLIDHVQSLAALPLHRLYSTDPLPEADLRFWKTFDRVISWTGAASPDFCRNLRLLHSDACIASWKPAAEEPRHVAQIFADSIAPLAGECPGVAPVFLTPDADLCLEGRQWLLDQGWNGSDPLAAIHPGAGGAFKQWPLPRFFELARQLVLKEKHKLLIIEGPAERGIARQFSAAMPGSDLILSENAGLGALAGILSNCTHYIGNDSGLSHLAAALGLRCLVLFGPTLPRHWAPLGAHVTVLHHQQGCAGCESGSALHTCLENITVEEVLRWGG